MKRRAAALAKERPELQEALTLQTNLLNAAFEEPVPQLEIQADAAGRLLALGVPLAAGLPLTIDPGWWLRTLRRLSRVAPVALTLVDVELNGPEAGRLAALVVRRDVGALRDLLAGRSVEPVAAWTALEIAASPVLAELTGRCDALIRAADWHQGYCPGCGAWPALAELRGPERDRMLRCALCGAAWLYRRVRCPFCGTSDHQHLGYLAMEGEGDYRRVDTCTNCRGYLKCIATLDPTPVELLPLEDLALAHLDLEAAARGFSRPGPPERPPWS